MTEFTYTDAEKEFAETIVETGGDNISAAYRKAYPNAATKYLAQEAYKLLRKPKIQSLIEQIQQDLRAKFILLAPAALERLEDLAENSEHDKVKLEANKEILDRAGLKAPERVEMGILGVFGQMDPEKIKSMVRSKQEEAAKAKQLMKEKES